jgi:hypothetical protein
MLDDILKQLRETQPNYKTTLPISNKEIEYHPFKVKDQKIITLISQEKHTGMILKNLCKLLESCSNIGNAEDLYLADFEFLFLQIRSKSVEEQIRLKVDSTPPIFGTMNINEIKVNAGKLKETISTDSGMILELAQPKVKDYLPLETINEEALIKTCIKSITINKFRYDLTLLKTEELSKILEEITVKDNKKILEFIKNSPKLFYILRTGSDEIKLEGFLRFFT